MDESSPMVDARLADGSRVNAIIPPLALDGPSLSIRKFAVDPLKTEDLIRFGTISPQAAELLRAGGQIPAERDHLRRNRHRKNHHAERDEFLYSRRRAHCHH